MVDGVRLIAGGIEDVLQRLRMQVRPHPQEARTGGPSAVAAMGLLCCYW